MKKFKREKAFFGVHFDFHATKDDIIGDNYSEKVVQDIVDAVNPDFLQCDSKGGGGLATYNTVAGTVAPGLKKDILKIWRDVTKKNDVGLYAHYAVWFNYDYLEKHPEWSQHNADGTPRMGDPKPHVTYFSPYMDEVVIPQLCELADAGIDGVWMDCMTCECVGDYRPEIVAEFKEKYGIDAPSEKTDSTYPLWMEFTRSRYDKMLKHITTEVHKKYPDFEICSAWDYTSYRPAKVEIDVDFLSGDVWGNSTVNEGRIEGRYMSQQGKPWDLMPWGFASTANDGGFYMPDKGAAQLIQDCAVIIAQGGGVQPYIQQRRDGTVDMQKLETVIAASEFCRERKSYCFRTESRSQIAILLSKYAGQKINPHAFGFWDGDLDPLKGIAECFINAQQSVDIVSEHHLDEKINNYELIVVPEWKELDNKEQLLDFAEKGGKLLIIGSEATKYFEKELGVTITQTTDKKPVYIDKCGLMSTFGQYSEVNVVEVNNAEILEKQYFGPSRESEQFTAVTVNNYGDGKITGIYFDIGRQYLSGRCVGAMQFIRDICDTLIKEPLVRVDGSRNVEVVLREKDNKLHIGLINGSGCHNSPTTLTFDEILPLNDITIEIKCKNKPTKIMQQPKNTEMDFTYENGVAKVKLDKLDMYEILVII